MSQSKLRDELMRNAATAIALLASVALVAFVIMMAVW